MNRQQFIEKIEAYKNDIHQSSIRAANPRLISAIREIYMEFIGPIHHERPTRPDIVCRGGH